MNFDLLSAFAKAPVAVYALVDGRIAYAKGALAGLLGHEDPQVLLGT